MIPQRSISLISNSLMSAGGRRIPEAVTERDYVLAWLLSGLAGHPWREVEAHARSQPSASCVFDRSCDCDQNRTQRETARPDPIRKC